MREYAEVLERARELVEDELERRLIEATKRLPHRCQHNHRQPLDVRRTVNGSENPTFNRIVNNGQTIGLCMLGAADEDDWQGTICEDPIDAQRCPYFDPVLDREKVLAVFKDELTNPEWIAVNMPELSTLIWVMNTEAFPTISRLRRWFLRFWKLKIEPIHPAPRDPTLLLPDRSG